MRTALPALILFFVATAAFNATAALANDPAASRRSIRADDLYGAASVSDPQVSPDGRWVAYIVTTNDRAADEPRSAIRMVSWDGSENVLLTRPSKGTRAPRWSPDGNYLAYVAKPAGAANDEIMVVDRRGGAARALTGTGDDVGDYAWAPDGKQIAVVMTARADDRPRADDQAPVDSQPRVERPKPIVIDALHFKQDEDGYLGTSQEHHLYLIGVNDNKVEALTQRRGEYDSLPAWSPDGRRIAFVRTREMGPDPDGMEDILVMDARANARAARVVRIFAPDRQKLAWSADASTIAYLTGQEPKFNQYIQDRLAVVSADGGAPRVLTTSLDRGVTSFAFAPDQSSITATVADDAAAYPIRVDLGTGRSVKISAGAYVISAAAVGGGHTAVLYTDDAAPPEIYALDGGRLRRLTSHNDALAAELRLGAVEDFHFKSKDGTAIHGLMVKPPDFVSGRRYPTIMWIHGGPNGQDAHELTVAGDQFKRQLLAAQGFVVLGINYRGGSGRGSAFQTAILADWGHREIEDLIAGINYIVSAGIADPHRLGIGGWSYGAILTNYAIAADGRFKAAVSGAGSANQTAMYGSDQYITQYNAELRAPWLDTARWIRLSSPFLHADRIHTPTLFMGGDRDFDVPLMGGEQMYQALRTLGIPTELVIYPGEYHTLTRPSFLKDRALRMAAWFARYL